MTELYLKLILKLKLNEENKLEDVELVRWE